MKSVAKTIDEDYNLSLFTIPDVYQNRVYNIIGGYKQVGNKVYVNITFKYNINLNASSWTIFINLPNARNLTPFMCTCNYGGGVIIEAKILNGDIIINPNASVPSGYTISIVGYYYV